MASKAKGFKPAYSIQSKLKLLLDTLYVNHALDKNKMIQPLVDQSPDKIDYYCSHLQDDTAAETRNFSTSTSLQL